ncbi:hypothetical protein WI666_01680 [Vibrio cholerae]
MVCQPVGVGILIDGVAIRRNTGTYRSAGCCGVVDGLHPGHWLLTITVVACLQRKVLRKVDNPCLWFDEFWDGGGQNNGVYRRSASHDSIRIRRQRRSCDGAKSTTRGGRMKLVLSLCDASSAIAIRDAGACAACALRL